MIGADKMSTDNTDSDNTDQDILTWCDDIVVHSNLIQARALQIKEALNLEPPEVAVPPTTVPAGANLQEYLNKGGDIFLAEDARYTSENGFKFTVHETTLTGAGGNSLTNTAGQCLIFPVNYRKGMVDNVNLATSGHEVIVQIGRNDTGQTTIEQAATDIVFQNITIPQHRGKRAFECNGASIRFDNVIVKDLFDPENQDSQAIWIGNSPGNVVIQNCHLEAASENIMVGGDRMKIPNCIPTNILIQDSHITKPIEWKGALTSIKNLIELKTGHNVIIRNCHLWNCWKAAQDGFAFMITPAGGDGNIKDVSILHCDVHDVSSIINIAGRLSTDTDRLNRASVTMTGGSYVTNKAEMGGRGTFALIGRGPEFVIFDSCYIRVDGTTLIECYDSEPIDKLYLTNCDFNYPAYGIRIGGLNHGDNSKGIIKELVIEGNRITGANSTFKSRYPNNSYL